MADTKLADLTALTTPSGDDILYVVDDPAGTPADRKLALSDVFKRGTVTTSSPVIDAAQTWDDGGVTFTGLKFNATDTASASGSLLMDLQVGGASRFSVDKNGGITGGISPNVSFSVVSRSTDIVFVTGGNNRGAVTGSGFSVASDGAYVFTSGAVNGTADVRLTRRAAANLRLGAADAAGSAIAISSVASNQLTLASNHGLTTGAAIIITGSVAPSGTTLNVRYYARVISAAVIELYSTYDQATAASGTTGRISVTTAGTSASVRLATPFQSFGVQDFTGTDIPGQPFIIRGSRGTGTGAGGDIIFQVAPAGSSGTAQNALITGLTVRSVGTNNAGIFTPYLPNVGDSQSVIHGTSFGSTGNGPWVSGTQNGAYTISRMTTQSSGSIYFYTSSGNEIVQVFGTLGLGGIIQGPNVFLRGDAANTLALRNGANAQAFRVYNTYTSATEFERGNIYWDSNVLKIGTEKGSAGGTARALEFQTDGTTRLTISNTGAVSLTGDVTVGAGSEFTWSASTKLRAASGNGTLRLSNNAANDFDRLQFGGTTSSFPALKRSTTSLQAVLADDTGFTNIQGKLTTDTAYTAGAPTATGYIVLYDSTGTAYKIPAEAL